MLPRHTSPSTLPATQITNKSLKPWPKIISVGTRASEQPTTTANGACLGICPNVRTMPTSSPLHGTTYCGSEPGVSVCVWQLCIHCENIRLPASKVRRAESASGGVVLALGFLGSKR